MAQDCTDLNTGFDTVGSASAYSALAGVIAGVLFTGVVLLVSTRPAGSANTVQNHNRTAALEVMVPTFFVMLVTSFLFAVIGGEQVCRRANVEALSAGTLLAVGGMATFQAIAWMLESFESGNGRLAQIAMATRISVAAIGVVQLAVTAEDVQISYLSSPKGTLLITIFLVAGLLLVTLLAVCWLRRWQPFALDAWTAAPALLVLLLIVLAVFDVASNSAASDWTTKNPPVPVTVGVFVTMASFLVAMVVHLLGAPKRP